MAERMIRTNVGEFHWSIHYLASNHPDYRVYEWKGDRVVVMPYFLKRAPRAERSRVELRNVDGVPKGLPSERASVFSKMASLGTLGEMVFGKKGEL